MSAHRPSTNRSRSRTRQRIAFGAIICTVVAVIVISQVKTRAADDARLDRIIAEVRSGATTRPFDDRLILNHGERQLSEDGIAYLTGPGPDFLLFPRWRGPGTRLAGSLWSLADLKVGADVQLLVPRTPRADESAPLTRIAPTTMAAVRVTRLRKPNWYEVERSQD